MKDKQKKNPAQPEQKKEKPYISDKLKDSAKTQPHKNSTVKLKTQDMQ
mgnify:CR=1 FL=1